MIQTWSEFLEILKSTKKSKIKYDIKFDARSLYTMLYAGCFDSLLDFKPTATDYEHLSIDLAKAVGSKAQLPKATKTQKYGIVDIKGRTLMLHLWRNQSNPIYSFDFISFLKPQIITSGFTPYIKSKDVPFMKFTGNEKQYRQDLWVSFRSLKDNKKAQTMYKNDTGLTFPCFAGIITDVRKLKYCEGMKERLVFKVFTGNGSTSDIVVWPKRDKVKVDTAVTASIKEGAPAIVTTRAGEYKGELSLTFKNIANLEMTNEREKEEKKNLG